jgi:hypothetical protein
MVAHAGGHASLCLQVGHVTMTLCLAGLAVCRAVSPRGDGATAGARGGHGGGARPLHRCGRGRSCVGRRQGARRQGNAGQGRARSGCGSGGGGGGREAQVGERRGGGSSAAARARRQGQTGVNRRRAGYSTQGRHSC